jgi:hypothetical protein
MRDYISLTHIKVKEHERLYNITHTYQSNGTRACFFTLICVTDVVYALMFLYFDLCESCCIVSHVPLLWDYTTSLTHIKVKENEKLYSLTHRYQSKGTWETIHHSHIPLLWFVWVVLYCLSCFFTLICVSDVV